MVNTFPLDPLHLTLLGVTRKILNAFLRGKCKTLRLSSSFVDQLSERISFLSRQLPSEFCRRGRSLREIDNWKGTEFRLFLCYTAFLCVKDFLREDIFQHLMKLMVAIRLLSEPKPRYVPIASNFLRDFVLEAENLYGEEFMVYNVHGLLHLCDDVLVHGSLESFSCFPFESFLGTVKKFARSRAMPLAQLCPRVSEYGQNLSMKSASNLFYSLQQKHQGGSFVPGDERSGLIVEEYRVYRSDVGIFKLNDRDCYFSDAQGKIYKAFNFVELHGNGKFVVCKLFQSCTDFFTEPMRSSDLDIFVSTSLSTKFMFRPLSSIVRKNICFLHKNQYVLMTLLHSRGTD